MARTRVALLRNNLRVHDNAVLYGAPADRLLPVFVWDESDRGHPAPANFPRLGLHRRRFLLESLLDLRASLRARGSDLLVLRGRLADVGRTLARELGAGVELVLQRECASEELDEEQELSALGCTRVLWGATLHHVDDLPSPVRQLPNSFTAFHRRLSKLVRAEAEPPAQLPPFPAGAWAQMGLEELDVDAALSALGPLPPARFAGGETAALARLQQWVFDDGALGRYKQTRNGLLGMAYSSKFSPWLAAGCLSPRRVAAAVAAFERERGGANESTAWLLKELGWRDWFMFGALALHAELFHAAGEWRDDPAALAAWTEGRTGVPIVDAAMRELAATGFVSNRGRQIAASFLTHDLGLDWRLGAAWFEASLVDHEPAANYGNWRYVAFGRRFNPIKQAKDYDPDAAFVRHWVPELAAVPDAHVHHPWTAGVRVEMVLTRLPKAWERWYGVVARATRGGEQSRLQVDPSGRLMVSGRRRKARKFRGKGGGGGFAGPEGSGRAGDGR